MKRYKEEAWGEKGDPRGKHNILRHACLQPGKKHDSPQPSGLQVAISDAESQTEHALQSRTDPRDGKPLTTFRKMQSYC